LSRYKKQLVSLVLSCSAVQHSGTKLEIQEQSLDNASNRNGSTFKFRNPS